MKLILALTFLVFACFARAQNQSSPDLLALAVEELPTCALQCTLTTVGASECELTDVGCIKNNTALQAELSVCVRASCSIRESLTAKRFLQTLLGAKRRNKEMIGTLTSLIMGTLAILAFLLRVIARLPNHGANKWGLDDWAITLAMVFVTPLTFCAYALNQIGMGKDMWFASFEHITRILKIFYFTELLYLTGIGLIKISILLFYLRIFPEWKLRRAIYGVIGACVVYIVVFVTVTALQCVPTRIAWEKWDGEHHGKCLNLNAIAWVSAALNILLDLIVIVLPLKQLKGLKMSWKRKFGVMVMFLGGGFVTIVSVLRLEFLIQFAHTDNVTWDYLPVGYWSAVETHVGVMVACAPAIRGLQRSIRDRLFPKPVTSTSYYEDDTANSNSKRSKNNSRNNWTSSKTDKSRMSALGRKEDFVQIDEFEMDLRTGYGKDARSPTEASSECSVTRSFTPNDDVAPLTATAAPIGQGVNGIVVQKDFSVGTASREPEQAGVLPRSHYML